VEEATDIPTSEAPTVQEERAPPVEDVASSDAVDVVPEEVVPVKATPPAPSSGRAFGPGMVVASLFAGVGGALWIFA